MADLLTPGAIGRMRRREHVEEPILQVIDIKRVGTDANSKIRLACSDGAHFSMAFLASQQNPMVDSGEIKVHTIIKVANFVTNEQNGRIVHILLKVTPISDHSERIGNPTHVDGAGAAAPGAPAGRPLAAPSTTGALAAMPVAPTSSHPSSTSFVGAVVPADPATPIVPIESLNPYHNRWTIRARVTSKSEKKSWNNQRGAGTLFKIELLDEQGGEISAAFFKDACEKFYPLLEVNKVYTFSNGKLKVANRQYSTCNNDHEITFNMDADIRPVADDAGISAVKFNFVKFNTLEKCSPNSTVDIIGVVKRYGDSQELVSRRSSSTLQKRDLTMVDDTSTEVNLTVWGDKALEDPQQWDGNPVVAVKKVKVSDYNGCSLSSLSSSMFYHRPDVPEATALQQWWDTMGHQATPRSLSRASMEKGGAGGIRNSSVSARKPISCIREQQMGYSEKADFITAKATVTYIHRKEGSEPWYVSEPESKYKCVEQPDGTWFCERLNKAVEHVQRRYLLSVTLADHSGSHMVSLFDDQARVLLGMTADEMHELMQNGETSKVDDAFKSALFKEFIVAMKIKQETYNDESRIKVIGSSFASIDPVTESKQLIEAIGAY